MKFGTSIYAPCEAVELLAAAGSYELRLRQGAALCARTVIVATGAQYRTLPLARWAEFENAGIFYAATELEARSCESSRVVIGGGNSAGQAAVFLASRGSLVTLVIRGPDLAAGMSQYLVDRVLAHRWIDLRTSTEIVELHGGTRLQAVTLVKCGDPAREELACSGLFSFIGADPATEWLTQVDRDRAGFITTGEQMSGDAIACFVQLAGRRPLPLESSWPGVFAAGDVRLGSMKRVASAVGEGATVVSSIHRRSRASREQRSEFAPNRRTARFRCWVSGLYTLPRPVLSLPSPHTKHLLRRSRIRVPAQSAAAHRARRESCTVKDPLRSGRDCCRRCSDRVTCVLRLSSTAGGLGSCSCRRCR